MRRALLLCVLAASAAEASRRFPEQIQRQLNLGYVPVCSLCHVRGNTGSGTAQTPFAISARARGMTGGDNQALLAAIDQLAKDGVDSDGDGVSDLEELLAGTDPNVRGPQPFAAREDPSYGCSSAGVLPWAVLLLLGMRGRRSLRPARPSGGG